MEPSQNEKPPVGKPAQPLWPKVVTGLFVALMGVRMVLLFTKREPTPAERLAQLPRLNVPPPEPIRIDLPPPPDIKIPELKPMSAAPIVKAPGDAPAAPARPEPTSEPEVDGVAELTALQKGGEKARAAARRLLDHPECGDISVPFLLLGSELVSGGKSYKAILQVLQEERRTDRVALVRHALIQGGADTRKSLVDLLVSWNTPEARAALEHVSKEHHRPEARALASEALAGLTH
jgi:hypothetical protein